MKLTIDTSNFNAAMRSLALLSGVPLVRILDNEATQILQKCAAETPSTTNTKIHNRHDLGLMEFTSALPDIYEPQTKAGKIARENARLTKNGFLRYYVRKHRYPAALWSALEKLEKERIAAALKAKGLTKQTWWKLGNLAGLAIRVPGYVLKAIATTAKTYANESFKAVKGQHRCGLYFKTKMPLLRKRTVDGAGILARALAGRVKYFETNLRKGVFNSIANIAKRYPGLKISNS
jgi:hypothetical protein